MSAVSVAIRVDSGVPMGSGHLMRCLTLADELRLRGAQVRFLSRPLEGNLIGRLESAGHAIDRLAPVPGKAFDNDDTRTWLGVTQEQDAQQSLAACAGRSFDWLVVDHYAIDANWETRMRGVATRLLVIDDLADRAHDADLLLDQSHVRAGTANRYTGHVPARCRLLLGPRYALLQPQFRTIRATLAPRDGRIRRIAIFFGAHDMTRATLAVLEALDAPEFAQLAIDVVPGNEPTTVARTLEIAKARSNVTVHQGLASLAPLLARADLALGAGGTTTFERACLGLPAVVATTAANQVPMSEALATDGFIVLLGASPVAPAAWAAQLKSLLADPGRVAGIGQRAMTLTDGHGAGRVAHAMSGAAAEAVRLRRAVPADEALLLAWANDADVRRFAFSPAQIDAAEHHRWYAARLADPACAIFIGEDSHGLPLGQVRFESDGARREASIDVSVDAAVRGSGVGNELLRAALATWRRQSPGYTAVAEVLEQNEASARLFARNGFAPSPVRRAGSRTFELRP